ncbi:MAG: hypothetical protein KDD37_09185 [Bdellovibrionales bacterium]|nr:hypothetical protein [Bdellovibrionales bacterium]
MSAASDETHGEYLRIRVAAMVPNKSTTFDLYILINGKFICYLKSGDSLSQDKIDRLKSAKTDVFHIKEEDKQEFKKYVHDRVTDSSLSSSEKAVILKESSYALIEELYEHPDVEKALNDSKEIITNFVEFMDQESDAISNLIGLSSHDFYTYYHPLDVRI